MLQPLIKLLDVFINQRLNAFSKFLGNLLFGWCFSKFSKFSKSFKKFINECKPWFTQKFS